jgi:hypothetical protein
MTSFSSVQYTSSGSPRTFPQVKKQIHLGKDARISDVLHFVCYGEETWNCMHFLVILSLKTLWADVKHWWTALHRFYVYRKPIDHLQDPAIWKWFKNVYISFDSKCICAWCLDNWSRILSGKPFKTFSMARLKTLQFRLTLSPFLSFHCHACIFFFSFTIFFHDLWLG